jgi:hypothetical protein
MQLRTISPLTWALVAALAVAGVQSVRLDAARVRCVRAAMVADSAAAARDTTRVVPLIGRGDKPLFDSLRVVQRRAMQIGQRADALDRALGLERVVRARLETTVGELRRSGVAETVLVTTAGDSVRRAVFDVRQAPYTVHAEVVLPQAPKRALMELRVALDTLGLDVRIGCGSAALESVRPASVSVAAPAWANVRLGRVEQAPEVCARGVFGDHDERWSVLRSISRRFGVTVGYVAARAENGTVTAGPGIGLGFRLWP